MQGNCTGWDAENQNGSKKGGRGVSQEAAVTHSKLTWNCWCGVVPEGGSSPSCEVMPPVLAGQPRHSSGVGALSLQELSGMIIEEHLPLLLT